MKSYTDRLQKVLILDNNLKPGNPVYNLLLQYYSRLDYLIITKSLFLTRL